MHKTGEITLTVGTRTSKLARWQTTYVVGLLQDAWPGLVCHTLPFITRGDKTLHQPLPQIGGKGLFTAELESALRDGDIDLAVHSLKDLPVANAPGLALGAIVGRADTHDALVARQGHTLQTLSPGAVVGTSSLRRQAQLLLARPDLVVRSIRGNVETRVQKALSGDYDAAILAAAGLKRLDMENVVTEWLPYDVMLPAPGQGALAVQCRAEDVVTLRLLAAVNDDDVCAATTAERHFLQALGGGCSAPIAALASLEEEEQLKFQGLIASPDGARVVRVSGYGRSDERGATELGERMAAEASAKGGGAVLAALETAPATAASAPLQGQRIVVTRAQHQAPELSERLREEGAIPLSFPTIAITPMPDTRPLDRAIKQLARYDWVIFTSVNGVSIFWERMAALDEEIDIFEGVHVAAIGPATGDALAQRGVEPDFIPDEFVAERIAEGLGDVSGLSILLPRAQLARETLATMLEDKGARVDEIATYRTLPATPDPEALDLLQQANIFTFTSSSTVRNFVDLAGGSAAARRLTVGALIACIGPITADTAAALGLEADIVADEYTMEGLVAALVEHVSQKR